MKPVALFSSKSMSSQEVFSDREDFSSEHQQVLGNNETYSDSLIRKIISNHSLKNIEIILLAEAKSEVRRHESRADYLDSSVRDLQRQLDSNRLENYCTCQGYEESRKEQARLMKN